MSALTQTELDARFVLIVDDQEGWRTALEDYLDDVIGFKRVSQATNLREARSMLDERPITDVWCDLRIPGGDAVQFLVEARSSSPHVRCTLVTGFPSDLTQKQKLQLQNLGIQVVDKSDVRPDWLASLGHPQSQGMPESISAEAAAEFGKSSTPRTIPSRKDVGDSLLPTEKEDLVMTRLLADRLQRELDARGRSPLVFALPIEPEAANAPSDRTEAGFLLIQFDTWAIVLTFLTLVALLVVMSLIVFRSPRNAAVSAAQLLAVIAAAAIVLQSFARAHSWPTRACYFAAAAILLLEAMALGTWATTTG